MQTTHQKILGSSGLIALIALLSAFVPLSTDLYLPALPHMAEHFNTSADKISLTLSAFFICYAIGTVIWGPLSDNYGRKPILVTGLGIYVAASLLCSISWNIETLILFRILQAIGGSAAGSVATAIVKDSYSGKGRESVLAIVQSMVLISPALAPVLGAWLLTFMSWRGVFWTLTVIGILTLLGSLLFEESLKEKSTGALHHSLLRLINAIRNPKVSMLVLLFAFNGISSLAFVASSTYIYQEKFGLSGQVYSYYFSLNAIGLIAGPMIFLRLTRYFSSTKIIRGSYIAIALGGLLVATFGSTQPWIFALCMLPASIAGSCMRPPSANMVLEQQKHDAGAVSSLLASTGLLMGSLGMTIISLPWNNTILALGLLTFGTAAITLLAWPFIMPHVNHLPEPTH